MMNLQPAQLAWACGAVLLLLSALVASWYDGRYRRIPNWLCAATALAGLAVTAWSAGPTALPGNALHLLIALVVGMVLFRLGVFGGGDAKYYAAVAGWFGMAKAVLLLLSVTMSGLVLLVIWFTSRRLAGVPIRRTAGSGLDGLPYGIAIGAGAVIAMATTLPPASPFG